MFKKKVQEKEVYKCPQLLDGMAYEDAVSGYKYLHKAGKNYRFVSDRAFQSWNLPLIRVASVHLREETRGGLIGFRDGTLLENIADGNIYLISGNRSRHIQNPDWLFEYGLLAAKTGIVLVSQEEYEVHKEGEPLG